MVSNYNAVLLDGPCILLNVALVARENSHVGAHVGPGILLTKVPDLEQHAHFVANALLLNVVLAARENNKQ
jgi:hypothetical protein